MKVNLKLTTPPHAWSNGGIKYTSSPRHIDHDVALSRPDDEVRSVSHGRAGGRRELVHPRQAFFVDGDGKARQGVNNLFIHKGVQQPTSHKNKNKKGVTYTERKHQNRYTEQNNKNTVTQNDIQSTVTQNKLQHYRCIQRTKYKIPLQL